MSSVNEHKKSAKRMGRPPVDSELARARLDRPILAALDAYASDEAVTRPQAIRAILADWLRTHGYAIANSPMPAGPRHRRRRGDGDGDQGAPAIEGQAMTWHIMLQDNDGQKYTSSVLDTREQALSFASDLLREGDLQILKIENRQGRRSTSTR